MKAIQMTLDEKLIKSVDKLAKKMGKSRSAFTRDALRMALDNYKILELEKKHKAGYSNKPVEVNEFISVDDDDIWSDVWGMVK